jgi:hypothetical protein
VYVLLVFPPVTGVWSAWGGVTSHLLRVGLRPENEMGTGPLFDACPQVEARVVIYQLMRETS